ncbi:MAG: nucleotidyltransferase family protein, partial [Verrucomicrobiota bacterium]
MTRYQAFRFLTRCLALRPCDAGEVDRLKMEIVSGQVDWGKVVELASHHYMIVALVVAFREHQLAAVLSEEVLEYFEEIHGLSAARNQRIRDQVFEIARALNTIGVEPVLLKGAANLIAGLYSDPASRLMFDIDILVPEGRVGECFQKLLQE